MGSVAQDRTASVARAPSKTSAQGHSRICGHRQSHHPTQGPQPQSLRARCPCSGLGRSVNETHYSVLLLLLRFGVGPGGDKCPDCVGWGSCLPCVWRKPRKTPTLSSLLALGQRRIYRSAEIPVNPRTGKPHTQDQRQRNPSRKYAEHDGGLGRREGQPYETRLRRRLRSGRDEEPARRPNSTSASAGKTKSSVLSGSKDQQFLYETDGKLVFMDNETYEQTELDADLLAIAGRSCKWDDRDNRVFREEALTVSCRKELLPRR